ncbi:hypothetical protein [Streptomyces roseolilacinus]|uniref:Secreted protein n=1 Tax=Streptomyces roseolilacinus TaxID=66904 RepID=A0A918EMK9_9ACTN|nr:hypothetical protein GCM10010249_48850 [Streptomyces roseolilacinus]
MVIRHHRTAARTAVSVLAPVLLAGFAVPAGPAAADGPRERAGASCRTEVEGSRVTAYCHNPYPRTDRVRLHVECARWWDVDADSAPAEVPATAYVELTARCWKEVRAAWISHDPLPGPGS